MVVVGHCRIIISFDVVVVVSLCCTCDVLLCTIFWLRLIYWRRSSRSCCGTCSSSGSGIIPCFEARLRSVCCMCQSCGHTCSSNDSCLIPSFDQVLFPVQLGVGQSAVGVRVVVLVVVIVVVVVVVVVISSKASNQT